MQVLSHYCKEISCIESSGYTSASAEPVYFLTHFTQFRIMKLASTCAWVVFSRQMTRYLVSLRGSNQLCRTPWDANHEKVGTSARYQHRTSVATRRTRELSAHHYCGHHYRETQFAVMPFSASLASYRENFIQRILKALSPPSLPFLSSVNARAYNYTWHVRYA